MMRCRTLTSYLSNANDWSPSSRRSGSVEQMIRKLVLLASANLDSVRRQTRSIIHTHANTHTFSLCPICLSVYLSSFCSINLSIHLSMYLSLYTHPQAHLRPIPHLYICPSVRPSISLSLSLSTHTHTQTYIHHTHTHKHTDASSFYPVREACIHWQDEPWQNINNILAN